LDTLLFEQITDTLAKVFKVDTTKQRMDSVHIKSNMRRLGRIGILVRCLHKFLVNLKRQYKELFETLPKELVEKYLSEKAVACFSLVKPSETERTWPPSVGSFPGRAALCGQSGCASHVQLFSPCAGFE
jgi:hypothetical protein